MTLPMGDTVFAYRWEVHRKLSTFLRPFGLPQGLGSLRKQIEGKHSKLDSPWRLLLREDERKEERKREGEEEERERRERGRSKEGKGEGGQGREKEEWKRRGEGRERGRNGIPSVHKKDLSLH